MKSIKLILMVPISVAIFSSCNGDHTAKNTKDTSAKTSYGVKTDTSKLDTTSKVSAGGDAALDNSGSGGTKIVKPDSTKQ